MSGIKKLAAELSVKYGNQAKVKPGKPYTAMTHARPSNTMKIVVLYKDGRWEEYGMSLRESNIDYDNADTVCFLYVGNTYLTINTYTPKQVVASTATPLNGTDHERKEIVHTVRRVQPARHIPDHATSKPLIEPEVAPLVDDEDIDLPW